MPEIVTQIELPATPDKVRSVFLDFASWKEWSTSFLKHIEVTKGNTANPQPGDTLKVTAGTMTFSPKVLVNDETMFKWRGALPVILTGDHRFEFTESKTTPGGTTFIQAEQFSGLLGFVLAGKGTKAGFESFNQDLLKKIESL